MFKTARIRLTLWYLIIIMLVSVIFSIFIYQILGREVERFARMHIRRVQIDVYGGLPPQLFTPDDTLPQVELDLIRDAKAHILFNLLIVNGVILVFSGGLAYFLAGKTLRPIQEMMDEQNRFVSDASHELRTPLTALKTTFEVSLRDKTLDLTGAKTILTEGIQDVNRLQSLSEHLLQLTQYQHNGIRFGPVSVNDVVREAVKKIEPLAKKKNIRIEHALPVISMTGNKDSLADLVVILLDNAVKYSGKNKRITIAGHRRDKSVILEITDEGIGIAEKDLPYIFDRFYRADSARTKTTRGGYGLGLSIAKQIVALHKGQVTVDSTVGVGTTFRIQLPVKQ